MAHACRRFRRRRLGATRERLHAALRERIRGRVGRQPRPSPGILDSQSVETATAGGVRDDGAEEASGRRRHLPAEARGPALRAKAHTAAARDRAAVPPLLDGAAERSPRLGHVRVDRGHTGTGRAWIGCEPGWSVEVAQHPRTRARGFRLECGTARGKRGSRGVLPRRRAVERAFARLGRSRRLGKEPEHPCENSQAPIDAAMTRLMARRLATI